MALYRYKAVTLGGDVSEGSLEAANREEAVGRLQAQGQVPIRVDAAKQARWSLLASRDRSQARRASSRLVPALIRQFETLLRAGLPLDRALDLVEEQATSKLEAQVLKRMGERLRSGGNLSDAMGDEPLFPPFCAAIVRAGEAGGSLETALATLAQQMDKALKARERLQSALLYPAIVTAACGFSILFLFAFVVPRFQAFFENSDADIPAITQAVLALGIFFEQYGWTIPVVGIFILGAALLYLNDPEHRRAWAARLLTLPVLGTILVRADTAQFCRALGTLLKNGVPLTRALDIAVGTFRNPALAGAVSGALGEVKEGRGLSDPLARTGVFPRFALRLIRIGEEAARLDDMLVEVADVYDRETERDTERLLSILSPALTVILGLVVAVVVGSILLALMGVYQLAV
jgi:general secretion pathway protein F